MNEREVETILQAFERMLEVNPEFKALLHAQERVENEKSSELLHMKKWLTGEQWEAIEGHWAGGLQACARFDDLCELAAANAKIAELQGAMRTDEERLKQAAQRVWGDGTWYGCDTPDWLAEEVEGLRAKIENQAQEIIADNVAFEDDRSDYDEVATECAMLTAVRDSLKAYLEQAIELLRLADADWEREGNSPVSLRESVKQFLADPLKSSVA